MTDQRPVQVGNLSANVTGKPALISETWLEKEVKDNAVPVLGVWIGYWEVVEGRMYVCKRVYGVGFVGGCRGVLDVSDWVDSVCRSVDGGIL